MEKILSNRQKDLSGLKFDRLLIVKPIEKHQSKVLYECLCECGNITNACDFRIKSGHTKSCGCLRRELTSKRFSNQERFRIKVNKDQKFCILCKEVKTIEEFGKKGTRLDSRCKCCINRVVRDLRKNEEYRTKRNLYVIKWRQTRYTTQGKKKSTNELALLGQRYRTRLWKVLKRNGFQKEQKSIEYLGCSINQLKSHLQNLFTDGMNWQNRGFYGWHIDHIVPLSSANSLKELTQLFHYTNLQPLWGKDNMSKGGKLNWQKVS